jgi:hypothetical protein
VDLLVVMHVEGSTFEKGLEIQRPLPGARGKPLRGGVFQDCHLGLEAGLRCADFVSHSSRCSGFAIGHA